MYRVRYFERHVILIDEPFDRVAEIVQKLRDEGCVYFNIMEVEGR